MDLVRFTFELDEAVAEIHALVATVFGSARLELDGEQNSLYASRVGSSLDWQNKKGSGSFQAKLQDRTTSKQKEAAMVLVNFVWCAS
jgi:hypothetical protein